MRNKTERINRLVGNLLSLSRVEADEQVRSFSKVDLVASVAIILRNLNPLAIKAGVSLKPLLPAHPVQVAGDNSQLVRVFTNLFGSAIK